MRIGLAVLLLLVACGDDDDAPPDAAPDPGENPQVVAEGGTASSLAYVAGRPAVAYVDSAGAISFAIANGEAPLGPDDWTRHVVDASAGSAQPPSLVEADGRAVIAYGSGDGLEVAVASVAVPADTADWAIHSVDADPQVGAYASIDYATFTAVGVQHRIAVAYYDAGTGALKMAYTSQPIPTAAADWTIVTVDDEGDCGLYAAVSVEVRTTFQMAVAYYEETEGDLRFVRALSNDPAAPTDWEVTNVHVFGDAGAYVDIAYAPAMGLGQANAQWFMAYQRGVPDNLWFASVEINGPDAIVDSHVVDNEAEVGFHPTIALVEGKPVIVYRDDGAARMKIARTEELDPADTDSWHIADLDVSGDVGEHADIAISPCGPEDVGDLGRVQFVTAYNDGTNGAISMHYTTDAPGSWFVHRAHPTARTLLYGAAVEVDGRVVAVYGDRAGRTLEVATSQTGAPRSTEDWIVEILATGVDPTHVTMAVIDGEPVVAYLDRVAGTLEYGRRSEGAWQFHQVADRGRHARVGVLAGAPAIALFDEGAGELQLARSSQSAPSTSGAWSFHTVATGIAIPDGVSVAELDGAPVLHYADNLAGFYAAATTPDPADPSDWSVHAMDIESSTVVTPSHLLILDGRPAVVHRDFGRLSFSLATSPTPTSAEDWRSHLVHASNGSAGELFASVRNGRPVIGHWFGPPSGRAMRFATGRSETPTEIGDWNQFELVEHRLELPGMIPFGTVGSPTTIVFSSDGCLMTARPR